MGAICVGVQANPPAEAQRGFCSHKARAATKLRLPLPSPQNSMFGAAELTRTQPQQRGSTTLMRPPGFRCSGSATADGRQQKLCWSDEWLGCVHAHRAMFTHLRTTSVSTRADTKSRDSNAARGQSHPTQTTEGTSRTLGQPLAGQQAGATLGACGTACLGASRSGTGGAQESSAEIIHFILPTPTTVVLCNC